MNILHGRGIDSGMYGHRRIAVANYDLPDDDPRKIVPEWIKILREPHSPECSMWWHTDYPDAQSCNCGGDQRLSAIANALESYLPPA